MFCPRCGIKASEGAKYCSNCGSPLPVLSKPLLKYCHRCGHEKTNSAFFCVDCGEALSDSPPTKIQCSSDENAPLKGGKVLSDKEFAAKSAASIVSVEYSDASPERKAELEKLLREALEASIAYHAIRPRIHDKSMEDIATMEDDASIDDASNEEREYTADVIEEREEPTSVGSSLDIECDSSRMYSCPCCGTVQPWEQTTPVGGDLLCYSCGYKLSYHDLVSPLGNKLYPK